MMIWMRINKTNDSYLKNHNIVKREQIRKPHSGVSLFNASNFRNYLIIGYRSDRVVTTNPNFTKGILVKVNETIIF